MARQADDRTDKGGGLNVIAREWKDNWKTGLAVFLGIGLGGSVGPAVFSLFIMPMEQEFGWSRGQIGLANLSSLAGAAAAPFVGRLIDRIGTRGPLLASFALMGLIWALLAAMPNALVVFYALSLMLNIVGLPSTGLGYARVICASFHGSRGFSLAVGHGGISVASTVLPMFLFVVIADHGWRSGYLAMAALALCIGLPIAWLGIERHGRTPSEAEQSRAEATPPVRQSTRQLLSDRKVVIISLAAALGYAPLIAIMPQAQPLLVGKGLAPESAVTLVSLFGVTSVIGALATGFLLVLQLRF